MRSSGANARAEVLERPLCPRLHDVINSVAPIIANRILKGERAAGIQFQQCSLPPQGPPGPHRWTSRRLGSGAPESAAISTRRRRRRQEFVGSKSGVGLVVRMGFGSKETLRIWSWAATASRQMGNAIFEAGTTWDHSAGSFAVYADDLLTFLVGPWGISWATAVSAPLHLGSTRLPHRLAQGRPGTQSCLHRFFLRSCGGRACPPHRVHPAGICR